VKEWALTNNHIPVRIQWGTNAAPPPPYSRYTFGKLDVEGFLTHVAASEWEKGESPLAALQEAVKNGLRAHCPRKRPSTQTRRDWSPQATALLTQARQARREAGRTGADEDYERARDLNKVLNRELRRCRRVTWREFVGNLHQNAARPEKTLWDLMRWSKGSTAETSVTSHMPALRRTTQEMTTGDNQQKALLLAAKFFSQTDEADLSDVQGEP